MCEVNMIGDFHFIRPWWLIGFIVLVFIVWALLRESKSEGLWAKVCDQALLPHLLIKSKYQQRYFSFYLFSIVISLGLLACAGPTWSQYPQPLYLKKSALIIALDVSNSMLANDIKPNRLARAKLKLLDLLETRKEGLTALLAYTSRPFTVTPLTLDTENIKLYVNRISTKIMPVQGSRPGLAIKRAGELFANAGISKGRIILVADSLDGIDVFNEAKTLADKGIKTSILLVASSEGAPIPRSKGGFIKRNGQLVISQVSEAKIKQFINLSGGRYHSITADDADLRYLLGADFAGSEGEQFVSSKLKTERWREQGPWLMLLILPFAALAFRRGWLAVFVIFILPIMPEAAYANSWDRLWLNQDQRGLKAYKKGSHDKAITEFKSDQWKASSYYRLGQYEKALELYKKDASANGFYNQGNALVHLHKYKQALLAYKRAFKLEKNHNDAKANYKLVDNYLKLLKRSPQVSSKHGKSQQSKDGKESAKKGSPSSGQNDSKSSSIKNQQSGQAQGRQSQQKKERASNSRSDSRSASKSNTNKNQLEKNKQAAALKQLEKEFNRGDKKKRFAVVKKENAEKDKKKSALNRKSIVLNQNQKQAKDNNSSLNSSDRYKLRNIKDRPGSLLERKFIRQIELDQMNNKYKPEQIDPW